MLGMAEIRQPLELVCSEVSEHRVHFQDDRKFGLLAHFNVLVNFLASLLGSFLGRFSVANRLA